MHYHFIVNPVAGRSTSTPLAEAVAEGLTREGHEATLYVTEGAGYAARHVAALAPDAADRIVVVGGDGTLREVVGARPPPLPWPVGLVPMGTANLVGREIRMARRRAVEPLVQGLLAAEPWDVDLIRLTQGTRVSHAVANVGVGADAEVVHAIEALRKQPGASHNYAQWVRPILHTIRGFGFPALRVTVDDRRTWLATGVVVQNAYNYGGMFALAPEASLDAEGLHVTLMRARTHRELMMLLASAATRRLARERKARLVVGHRVRIEARKRVPVQADGDAAGWTDVRLERLPKALTLLRAPARSGWVLTG